MKSKTINLAPFEWKVKFVYSEYLQNGIDSCKLDYKVSDTTEALAITNSNNMVFYVFLEKEHNNTRMLVHEINHVVLDLFNWLEYNPTEMQEFFCYYSDYLFNIGEKFYSKFK